MDITAQQKLIAWLEWRKWCSILRVGKPCPSSEELAEGKKDTISGEERRTLCEYLKRRLLLGLQSASSAPFWKNSPEEVNSRDPSSLISTFDDVMKGKNKSQDVHYKDYIFEKAIFTEKENGKSLVASVEDMIFSSRCGYIKSIRVKWLKEQMSFCYAKQDGKTVMKPVWSIDKEVGENRTLLDIVAEENAEDENEIMRSCVEKEIKEKKEEINEHVDALLNDERYDDRDWALVYLKYAGFPVNDRLVNEATERGHSANSERQNNMFAELRYCKYSDELQFMLPNLMEKIRKRLTSTGNPYKKLIIEACKRMDAESNQCHSSREE